MREKNAVNRKAVDKAAAELLRFAASQQEEGCGLTGVAEFNEDGMLVDQRAFQRAFDAAYVLVPGLHEDDFRAKYAEAAQLVEEGLI